MSSKYKWLYKTQMKLFYRGKIVKFCLTNKNYEQGVK